MPDGERFLLTDDCSKEVLRLAADLEPALVKVPSELSPPLTADLPRAEEAVVEMLVQANPLFGPRLSCRVTFECFDGDSRGSLGE